MADTFVKGSVYNEEGKHVLEIVELIKIQFCNEYETVSIFLLGVGYRYKNDMYSDLVGWMDIYNCEGNVDPAFVHLFVDEGPGYYWTEEISSKVRRIDSNGKLLDVKPKGRDETWK